MPTYDDRDGSVIPDPPGQTSTQDHVDADGTHHFLAPNYAQDKGAQLEAARIAQAKAIEDNRARNAHFQYGGWAGGADEAASRYAGLGAAAQGRQGPQLALGAVNDDRNANAQARGNSMSMAQLLADRASGKSPLISDMRANLDTSHALADQSSIAAGARGPAALALAQQNQANNSASAISNISSNAQINGAQERLNNTMAAGHAFNQIRGGDQSLMGADTGISVAQAGLNANQRAENDRYQLGMTGAETDVQKAQLAAQGNQAGIATGATTSANALAQQASQHSGDRADKYIVPAIGAAGTVAGGLLLGTATGIFGGPGDPQLDPARSAAGEQGTNGTSAGSGMPSDYGTPGGSNPSNSPGDGYWDENGHWIHSDIRAKAGIESEGAHPLAAQGSRADAFLDGIHPLSYTYKDARNEPRSQPTRGRYLGISAQDLESVPDIGKQMVSEGPNGKRIEVGPTLSAALAGMARLHERVKAVEGGTGNPLAQGGR